MAQPKLALVPEPTQAPEPDVEHLLAVFSHEIRGPLTTLLGFLELLQNREFEREQQLEFLGLMDAEGRRVVSLVNAFLDFHRLKRGAEPLHGSSVDLAALLKQATAVFRATQRTRQVQVELDVAPDLPPVLGDRDRIQQVLANLLSNAQKYSPSGSTVRVSARCVASGSVRLTVADQGMGVPAEAIPRLFEMFFRVDAPDRHQIRGTGLGLAIVREIVEAHGGRVWCESAGIGQGAAFHVLLPAAKR